MEQPENKTAAQENEGRFVEAAGDVVVDLKTRLMWLKKDSWQLTGKWMNWIQARDFAEQMNGKRHAGLEGWRMPTSDEARSLFGRNYRNKDQMGQPASLHPAFAPGFGFLCWTSDVRNKIQAIRFGYRKGSPMYDDIYRVSRGSTRLVRGLEKNEFQDPGRNVPG
ncbi:MAG: DUF1566 domain-containing protein [Nitrospinae bacterium]|nr:DUF1566 domain-containing protein [Nitrospinota bacterium]